LARAAFIIPAMPSTSVIRDSSPDSSYEKRSEEFVNVNPLVLRVNDKVSFSRGYLMTGNEIIINDAPAVFLTVLSGIHFITWTNMLQNKGNLRLL